MTDRFSLTPTFLNAAAPLQPRNATAAIIVNEKNEFLLQLRDDKEEIFFPNHWNCFGGAIEEGEEHGPSLLRELKEELDLSLTQDAIEQFITISYTTPKAIQGPAIGRFYYIAPVHSDIMKSITLGEGREVRFLTASEVHHSINVSPYDRFALWIYMNRERLV